MVVSIILLLPSVCAPYTLLARLHYFHCRNAQSLNLAYPAGLFEFCRVMPCMHGACPLPPLQALGINQSTHQVLAFLAFLLYCEWWST